VRQLPALEIDERTAAEILHERDCSFARECGELATVYAGVLWASERFLHRNRPVAARLRGVRRAIAAEFGWKAKTAAPALGSVLLASLALEARRLRRGRTYEPPTFFELNEAAARLEGTPAADCPKWEGCRFVEPAQVGARA